MFNLENIFDKENLNKYLCELLDLDYYLFGNCLNNYENRETIADVKNRFSHFYRY